MNAHEFKAARKALGLTQAELAEALGLAQRTYISAMERGSRAVSDRVRAQIATLKRVKALELESSARTDPPPAPTDPSPAAPAG